MYIKYTIHFGVIRQLRPKISLAMRLTFILVVCLMQVSAAAIAQKITLNKRNASLESVLKDIRKQSGYDYYFDSKLITQNQKVTVAVKDASIDDALKQTLNGLPLDYVIDGKIISIKKRESPPSPVPSKSNSQQINVSGKVIDIATGGPLAGATIKVKSSQGGVITQSDGQFFLPNVEKGAILIISYVGYLSQELPAKEDMGYIIMKQNDSKLDEVQVLAYGGTTTRRLSTGSVSKVTAAEIATQPVNNVLQALIGKVPGLNITQSSGLPGSDISFQIRGQNALDATNFQSVPLVVIDGVPYPSTPVNLASQYGSGNATNTFLGPGGYGSPLYNINPNDIESIEVLKDADATAIYGSRAGNGVILITTKKGKQGSTITTAAVNSGIGKNITKVDMLSTPQYLAFRRLAFKTAGATPTVANAPDLLSWDTTRNTNWQKELLGRTAHITDANLSMSGGTGGTSFLISGNYHKENTVYPDRRGSQSGGLHYSLSHSSYSGKFNATLSGMVDYNSLTLPQGNYGSYAFLTPPDFTPYDASGKLNWAWSGGNPYAAMGTTFESKSFSYTSNLQLRYNILKGLDARASVGYTRVEANQQEVVPAASTAPSINQSHNYLSNNRTQTINFEPQLHYVKDIGKGSFDALLGATIMKTVNEMPGSINTSRFTSDVYINDVSLAPTVTVQTGYAAYQYASLFARANYNWDNKYILNGSFRRDGSSRFGSDNRFGNFGALGAAWIFTKEKFMESQRVLSFGKLRSSVGWVGSDNVGNYGYLSTYVINSQYAGVSGLVPSKLDNPNYGWEKTRKTEAALELGFLNDRVLLNTMYYRNLTSNQLVSYPVSTQTGFASYIANLNGAVVENKGWEIELNTTNIKSKNFRWSTSVNVTMPQNKLLRFDGIENTGYLNSLVVGKSVNSIWAIRYDGVNSSGIPVFAHYTGKDASGNPQFKDVTATSFLLNPAGLAVYGKGDLQYAGKSDPTIYGGLSNSMGYKNFQFDFTFQFTKGVKKKNYLSSISQPGALANLPVKAVEDIHSMGLDKAFLSPNLSFNWFYYRLYSDALYTDASYARLTNMALSYSFPSKILTSWHISNLKAYVQAQNVLVISNYNGFDPETGALSLPPQFRMVLGLQCSF